MGLGTRSASIGYDRYFKEGGEKGEFNRQRQRIYFLDISVYRPSSLIIFIPWWPTKFPKTTTFRKG